MSGMARQYNANVAAGQQQEAEMDKLEYEYGLRSAIENASNVAAMARKEKEIASEEQQKKLERENKIKVQQQIGIENRETEKLKARLDGQNTGTSYQYPDPNNPDKMIGLVARFLQGQRSRRDHSSKIAMVRTERCENSSRPSG